MPSTQTLANLPFGLQTVLLYGSAQIQSAALTVPHPRMYERAFVLMPLAQIAPQRVTPQQLAAVQGQRCTLVDGD